MPRLDSVQAVTDLLQEGFLGNPTTLARLQQIAPGDFYAYPYLKQLVTEYQRQRALQRDSEGSAGSDTRRSPAGRR
jgi:hypothetical protein